MSFIFNCPDCGNQLQAEDEWDGIRSQCPFCGRDIVIRRTQETDIKYGRYDDGKENGQKSGFSRFFPLENVSLGLILKLSALIAVIGLIIFFIITGSLRTAFWIFVLLIIILRVRFSRMIPAKYSAAAIVLLLISGIIIHKPFSSGKNEMSAEEKRFRAEYERELQQRERRQREQERQEKIIAEKLRDAVALGIEFSKDGKTLIKCPENATSAIIPSCVTSINDRAFYGCKKLKSITIPDNVKIIGNYAFSGSGLTNVTLGNGITAIGERAFAGCKNLQNITIPDYVETIGNYAFSESGLTNITLGNEIISIGEGVFFGCKNLQSITIPDYVVTIGDYAFSESGLTRIILSRKLTKIGDEAFSDCGNLQSITLPNSVKTIGEGAFRRSGLNEVKLGRGLTYISRYAFANCVNLRSIIIPANVKKVGEKAFAGCKNLGTATIPAGMKYVRSGEAASFPKGCTISRRNGGRQKK